MVSFKSHGSPSGEIFLEYFLGTWTRLERERIENLLVVRDFLL